MQTQFKEGDKVVYVNSGNFFNGQVFEIIEIVPLTYDPILGHITQEQGFKIRAATPPPVEFFAYPEQLTIIIKPSYSAQAYYESSHYTDSQLTPEKSHTGHDIIENYAGGKTFKYCRNCKIEVM